MYSQFVNMLCRHKCLQLLVKHNGGIINDKSFYRITGEMTDPTLMMPRCVFLRQLLVTFKIYILCTVECYLWGHHFIDISYAMS